jgi:hypothetical protein
MVINLNMKDKPRIKLMHLVTEPNTNEKEIRSIESIKEFCELTGIKYEQRINKIWTELPHLKILVIDPMMFNLNLDIIN